MFFKYLAKKIFLSLGLLACTVSSSGLALEKPRDQGIGGTGIIGIITGFGSIFVNGYEIDYTPLQLVESDFGRVSPSTLRRGQVVRIVAAGEGTHLSAKSLAVEHEIIGPVVNVDKSRQQIIVLDQVIDVRAIKDMSPIKAGQWVAVSGFRDARGIVRASLIESVEAGAVQIIGNPKELSAYTKEIGILRLTAQERRARLILSGVIENNHFKVMRIKPWAFFGRKQNLTRISLEGFFNAAVGAKVDPANPRFLADLGEEKISLSAGRNKAITILNAVIGKAGLYNVEAIRPVLSTGTDRSEKSEETGGVSASPELLEGLPPPVNDVTNTLNQNVRPLPGVGGIIHNAPSVRGIR